MATESREPRLEMNAKRATQTVTLGISSVRLMPHLAFLYFGGRRATIDADLERWNSIVFATKPIAAKPLLFLLLMTFFPEYRNVFYARIGLKSFFITFLCPPMSTLFIHTKLIGDGLFFQHGFSTIVAAASIGKNCWINQQVTIGYTDATASPVIGNNVVISAGAKVLGGVTVGDNSRIGANAVVVKDVPPNVTVVGVPARIVRRDGVRVDEPL